MHQSTLSTLASLVATASLLLGCLSPADAIVDPGEVAVLSAAQDTLLLSDAAPTAKIAIDPESLQTSPIALEVPVVRIENQEMISFTITAALILDARFGPDKHLSLGTFGVFPADQTGTYTLSTSNVTEVAGDWGNLGELHLLYTLKPASENAPLKDVRVFVGPAVWRGE